ncbi:glycosyltransferase family 4 protein [Fuerstiella marisgermanici]|uniref:GDP-mannose-dependent alpha-(1-6)-phosphatidylinositol monomannoside mannosyltransferase n=1 Tax=Fuerstiella marisgermanici TaxID=1891926 RepID=A0A1P8WL72_9PLAN|nr:glycosyltransferase family 4 protein [Fuerstiella marisgermanici]APZ94809.1 GDP-mannose-dependent alpha-(1-6)-phosphatidylinositol monomannoside mannosyltransferase [Fuerstiella marisgermanici]
MPHIAVLFEYPTLNGGEHSMLSVLSRLRQDDQFTFTAIAPPVGPLSQRLAQLAIPLIPFSTRDQNDSKLPAQELQRRLTNVVAELQPDVLHSNSLSMSRLSGQLNASEPAACRRTGHLRDIIKLNKTVVADLNSNDALIAVSQATLDFHVAQGLNKDRGCVIYNGVDVNAFRSHKSSTERSQLFPNVPPDAHVLLTVGQICLRKGQLNIAKAVRQLLAHRDDIFLAIAGERHSSKAESVAYEAAIREEFETGGKADHLLTLGYRGDIAALMNAADVLVHAAHQEPFGRTLLEAAACQLPIIVTNVGGTPEMLQHNRHALLVEPNNVKAIADAILQQLTNRSLAKSRAASARQRIVDNFNVETAAANLARFWLARKQPAV